ncbi:MULTISPECIES: hypothetical protein [Terrabacteria group]|uniref:hypothetical protein n=1 Tax=Bacillati TaxID=1783272 RepID=UPI00193A637F|nr:MULTISPECIES: hypothetical protein [Terrabacteria group]MBW9212940.1 hypothetical protein [Trueperella sp. zg.1013]QRG87000.1 hypothetical protein JOS54_01435 [Bulleidia sp. zg-1006]
MTAKELWANYMDDRRKVYDLVVPDQVDSALVSEANWITRSQYSCGQSLGVRVKVGDICYLDYGQAYLNEMGYQHFGLVFSLFAKKALIIPMTSNPSTYAKAFDAHYQQSGKEHLMRIGLVPGLVKPSVLFLNDLRFINTARVIDVKAYISPDSSLFKSIEERVEKVVFSKRRH